MGLSIEASVTEPQPESEASDEEFNPDSAPAEDDESSSSSDDEASNPRDKTKKRARASDEADEGLDSGDEATIREHKRRKKRKAKASPERADSSTEDEGGEGGFVRTRAQRRVEGVQRRALASTKGATLDVGLIWERLSTLPIGRAAEDVLPLPLEAMEYVQIKRTVRFAGETRTEEKRVLKESQEAKLWFEEQEREALKRKARAGKENTGPEAADENADADGVRDADGSGNGSEGDKKLPRRRILKVPFRFDPNPAGEVRTLPANLQLRYPRHNPFKPASDSTSAMPPPPPDVPAHRRLQPTDAQATQLNTVQKSKYDWASYVDRQGLAEELDEYGRGKESYLGRSEFLGRVEGRREEERREARGKV